MDNSLDSLGDFPTDRDKQNTAAQADSHNLGSDIHLPTLKQIQKRLKSDPRLREITLQQPIPLEVLVQLDKLLNQAIQSMVEGKEPAFLSPMRWDAILILNRTGIRCSELTHLEVPSQADRQGCLEQDSSGSWWLLVKAKGTKANKEFRIPIHIDSGVIEAVHRQCQRISDLPDMLGEHYLFRGDKGLLSSTAIQMALRKLSVHLIYEGQPYMIRAHQLRNTIAQKMFELVKFMGHTSPSVCQYYVRSRLESLLKELNRFREELQRKEEQSDQEGEPKNEEQEGQEEGETGKNVRLLHVSTSFPGFLIRCC